MKIIDAAAGSIIAAIMTVQTARKTSAFVKDHPLAMPPIAMPAMPPMSIPAMSSMFMPVMPSPPTPPRTAIPIGMSMLVAW